MEIGSSGIRCEQSSVCALDESAQKRRRKLGKRRRAEKMVARVAETVDAGLLVKREKGSFFCHCFSIDSFCF